MTDFLLPGEEGRMQRDTAAGEPSFILPGEALPADRARQNIGVLGAGNPDKVAQARRLSEATGIPTSTIGRNPDRAQIEARLRELDGLMKETPVLAKAYADPAFAEIAHDDGPGLSAAAKIVAPQKPVVRSSEFSALVRKIKKENPTVDWDTARHIAASRVDVNDTDALIGPSTAPAATPENLVKGVGVSFVESFEQMRQGLRRMFADVSGFDEMAKDAALQGERSRNRQFWATPQPEGLAGDVYGGVQSTAQAVPALGLSLASGGLGLTLMGLQQALPAYDKYRTRGGSVGESFTGAAVEGIAEAGLEKLPMDFFVKKFGRVGFGEFLAGTLAREVPTEVATTIVQSATDTAIANPNKTWGDWVAGLPAELRQTVVATLTQSAIMGGVNAGAKRLGAREPDPTMLDAQRANAALNNAEALKNLVTTPNLTRERDPAAFAKFIDTAAEEGPVQDVFIDGRVLLQSGIDLQPLAVAKPELQAEIMQAAATGGDVRISLGDYAAFIAPVDTGNVLLQELRTSQDGMTQVEAQTYMQTQGEQIKAQAEKLIAKAQEDEARAQDRKAVEESFLAELQKINRFTKDGNQSYAALIGAIASTQAARLAKSGDPRYVGMTAQKFAQMFRLTPSAEAVAADNKVNEGPMTAPATAEDFAPGRVKDILQRGNWVVMTAENPNAQQLPPEENAARMEQLKSELTARGYQFVEVKGKYGNEENSLLVLGPTSAEALQLGEQFGQESVLTRHGLLYRDGTVNPATGVEEFTTPPEDFYSTIPSTGTRFSVGLDFDTRSPIDLANDVSFQQTGERDGKSGPGVRPDGAQQELGTTVAGKPPAEGWAGATRIRGNSGQPLLVHRGGAQQLVPQFFDPAALGVASGNPSSGLGVWFTTGKGEAGTYGNVESFYLDIRSPKVIKVEDLPGFDTPAEALAFRDELAAQGYDGIIVTAKHLGKQEVHIVAFSPDQVIRPAAQGSSFNQALSTRVPTAVKATENPLGSHLSVGLDAAVNSPGLLSKLVDTVGGYVNFPKSRLKNDKARAEVFVQHAVDNLLWLYDLVPAAIRARSKLWYVGANRIAFDWADKYGLTPSQTAAALAVLSPQKDWFQNVSLAERILDILSQQGAFRWDAKMEETAARIYAKEDYAADLADIRGKTLDELDSSYLKAMWVRTYDEAHNARGYRVVTPEGAFDDWAKNANGSRQKVAWGSNAEIAKAISVVRNGSAQNVHDQLGGQHKVRSFYNNIFDPEHATGEVTIDTHAVAAALLRPLAGGDPEVLDNFGAAGKSALTGVKGTYALYAEAYRRAAALRGVLPREMQSVTWEAVRGLFPDTFKTDANKKRIAAMWAEWKKGKVSLDELRTELTRIGGRVDEPAWLRSSAGANEAAWASSYSDQLREAGVRGGQPGGTGRGEQAGGAGPVRAAEARRDFNQSLNPAASLDAPAFGKSRPDGVDVVGVHFSTEARDALDPSKYGTGMKGAEREGVMAHADKRLRNRAFFYVPEGKGVQAERYVGSQAHVVQLRGLYDAEADPLGLWKQGGESAVLDAGFPGYYSRGAFGKQGTAVVFGDKPIPVKPVGGETAVNAMLGNTTAEAGKYSEGRVLANELVNDKSLPSGSLTRGQWARIIELTKPDLFGKLYDLGVFRGNPDERLYRDELVRTFAQSNPSQPVLLAPNGKPSHLPPALHAMVRTPAFKAWFGDWEKWAAVEGGVWADSNEEVSKVVDENGEPLVVYHGTTEGGFTEFAPEASKKQPASFFSSDMQTARSYSGTSKEVDLSNLDEEGYAPEQRGLYPAFLNIRNPNEVHFEGAHWDGSRVGQYVVENEDGDRVYADDGTAYFTDRNEAQALADEKGGEVVDAPDDGQSTDSVVREAIAYGNDGAIIRQVTDPGSLGDVWDPADVFAVLSPEQVKSIHNDGTFDANDPSILSQGDQARGQISFGNDITQTPSVITLFKNADLSTFIHEAGHFYLEVLAHIASQPGAPAEIASDFETTLKWMGVKDAATWQAMSLEEKTPYHEQFARGFEAYAFEGRAPSAALRRMFQRFAAWMKAIYREARNLNVTLDDEIRGVFDRMLASDKEIEQAEAARGYMPVLTTKPPTMTDEEWADYQRTGQEATADAAADLTGKALRNMAWLSRLKTKTVAAISKSAREARKAIRREVEDEVRQQPVYAAELWIKTGKLPTGEQTVGAKLDLKALKEMYGEGPAAPWRYLNNLAGNEGMHPDQVAELFGFTSGDELVRALLAAEPFRSVVDGITDQRMLEKHGEIADPEGVERAAEEAIHNEVRAKFLATELQALEDMTNPTGDTGRTDKRGRKITEKLLPKAAREFAEAIIGRLKVRDLKVHPYEVAEARAARNSVDALKKGDIQAAAVEKRNQLINFFAAKAARQAVDDVESAVQYLKKFEREGTRKALSPDYLDQIDKLLERFDLRRTSNRELDKRAPLLKWVESQREKGIEPSIPAELLIEATRTSYRNMTVQELRGLVDTVRQIDHLGRLKNKLLALADKREFEAFRDEVVNHVEANAKGTVSEIRATDRGVLVSARRLFRSAMAVHRKFASLVKQMDGYKDGGFLWEHIVRPMNERGDHEASRLDGENSKMVDLLAPLLAKGQPKMTAKTAYPSTGRSFTREERIGLLLNMGNETNRERIVTGERLTEAQLADILADITPEEAAFVNKAWEYLDSFWPEVVEKQKRLTGVAPEKVEGTPFMLNLRDGTQVQMRGGYFPIAYDPYLSSKSAADATAEVQKQIERGLYVAAQTRRGHTKARVESTGRKLRLDFGHVMAAHVQQVVHDLTWHEYLIDTNRLLRDKAVDSVIREHYGQAVLKELQDTLRDIAIGSAGVERMAPVWNYLRSGTTIASLGLNLFNAIQNVTGITSSMSRVGTKWVLKGALHWAGDAARFENSVAAIREKSEFMRLREKTFMREVNDLRNKITGKSGWKEAAMFYFAAKTQILVDTPTWWGAYEKAMHEADNEARAIAMADQAVRDSQGGGQLFDQSGIMRGGAAMKLLTTFGGYFSNIFNLTAEAVGRTDFKKPGDVLALGLDLALLYAIPALLTTLLSAALKGDWDDPEKLKRKMIADQLTYLIGPVMGLREAGAAVNAAFGQGGGYSGPAGMRLFSSLSELGKQAAQGEIDAAFLKAANMTAGLLFHYPAAQVNRTAEGVAALSDGKTKNPGVLITGPAK